MNEKIPGSGRQLGTPNKETKSLQALIEKYDCDPAVVLIQIAKGNADWFGEPVSVELRFKAASQLCQYLLPKRKAIEHTGNMERRNSVLMVPAPMSAEEWTAMVESQLNNAVPAKVTPS